MKGAAKAAPFYRTVKLVLPEASFFLQNNAE
jgi:hypothetical protein